MAVGFTDDQNITVAGKVDRGFFANLFPSQPHSGCVLMVEFSEIRIFNTRYMSSEIAQDHGGKTGGGT